MSHLLVNNGMIVGMKRCAIDHKRKTIKFIINLIIEPLL